MIYRVFLLLLTLIPHVDAIGQITSLANFLDCIELQNGADNMIINGRPYRSSHPKAEGHPYFESNEWKSGKVFINGNTYPSNFLKYNLYTLELIIKHERSNGTTQNVILSDLLVDSFRIENHSFVRSNLALPEKDNIGFLEKIYGDNLSFFRYQRKVFGALTSSSPFGRYSNQKELHYLILNGKGYKITRYKDFLTCFPDQKAEIKKYMKNHAQKWKKMTNNQFTQLLKFCYEQI